MKERLSVLVLLGLVLSAGPAYPTAQQISRGDTALLFGGIDAEGGIGDWYLSNGVVEATNVPDSPDYRLTYPGKGTLIHSRGFRRVRYDGRFDSHILDAAARLAFGGIDLMGLRRRARQLR